MRRTLVHRCALVLLLGLATAVAASAQKINADRSGLAIEGYDAVAYFTEGRPVQGSAQFEHTFEGVRYRFASAANRERFAQAPQRYLPQYGGFCAYAVSRGYTADTDPHSWRIVDRRLFLNYNGSAQRKWEEDVPGNIRKGDANWPKLAKTGAR